MRSSLMTSLTELSTLQPSSIALTVLLRMGNGDYDWARPIVFGTANALYVEDCSIIFDAAMPAFDTFTDQNRGGTSRHEA